MPPMTSALRVVEDPGLSPDERVRLVVRMLLGMYEMTEIELGRRLGLPRTSIYNRMQGKTSFTVAEVGAMGVLFDIPAGAFLAGPSALLRPGSGPVTVQKPARIRGAVTADTPTAVTSIRSLRLVAA